MSDIDAYCRAVEAHLCRRNDGHLIRLTGPAFMLVREWALRGIPLRIVEAGIDRRVERAARREPLRRRPMRLEFCEAEVLEAFEAWRRAVGVPEAGGALATTDATAEATAAGDPDIPRTPTGGRRASLATHIERALARLTVQRGSASQAQVLDAAIGRTVTALDGLLAEARRARGEARDRVIAHLRELDAGLAADVRVAMPPELQQRVRAQVEHDLAPFRARMEAGAYAAAVEAAEDRVWREQLGLPRLAFD